MPRKSGARSKICSWLLAAWNYLGYKPLKLDLDFFPHFRQIGLLFRFIWCDIMRDPIMNLF